MASVAETLMAMPRSTSNARAASCTSATMFGIAGGAALPKQSESFMWAVVACRVGAVPAQPSLQACPGQRAP